MAIDVVIGGPDLGTLEEEVMDEREWQPASVDTVCHGAAFG
jgi:hypothetical protein